MSADLHLDEPSRPAFDRRRLLKAGAWAAPALVVAAALPAAAASDPPAAAPSGSVPTAKLRIGDFRIEDGKQWDADTASNRGPLRYYLVVYYDQAIDDQRDPAVATLPWTLEIKPATGGSIIRTGELVVSKNQVWQFDDYYPTSTARGLAVGTYTFTFTVYGSNGPVSMEKKITL